MKIIYMSANYSTALVTGKYVRCNGRKPDYVFRVFEASSDKRGRVGMGPTLREYDTNGDELPADLKARCIETKMTEKWE